VRQSLTLKKVFYSSLYSVPFGLLDLFTTQGKMVLGDLFLLFIYAEILGMVAAFYKSERIPVSLPLIIAMTALTRMIVLQTKSNEPINIIYESAGILILAAAAYIMTKKDYISLKKGDLRESH
jgi:protein PsiE